MCFWTVFLHLLIYTDIMKCQGVMGPGFCSTVAGRVEELIVRFSGDFVTRLCYKGVRYIALQGFNNNYFSNQKSVNTLIELGSNEITSGKKYC